MKTRRMVATKPHKYGTRHLTAGEEYEVDGRHALALLAGKKARYAVESRRPPNDPPPLPPSLAPSPEPAAVAAPQSDPLEDLRMQASHLGIEVDRRWGSMRLQHEIAKTKVSRET